MSKQASNQQITLAESVYVEPPEDGKGTPEIGHISLIVVGNAAATEALQQMSNDFDFQKAYQEFIQNHFCTEAGSVVSKEVADALANVKSI